jgi:hypothetical protein
MNTSVASSFVHLHSDGSFSLSYRGADEDADAEEEEEEEEDDSDSPSSSSRRRGGRRRLAISPVRLTQDTAQMASP